MQRYFLKLAYEGTRYNGWQIQNNTPNTIQEVIQNALSEILRQNTEITGCGRTDTGVHAENFYAHFDSELYDLHVDPQKTLYKLNKLLPPEIAIDKIIPVRANAHARFDALSREYSYKICRKKNPFFIQSHWYLYGELNEKNMIEATRFLIGEKDFSCFSKSRTQTKTNICNIEKAEWFLNNNEWIFHIKANRFLRNMVRAIVGTLIDVGKNEYPPEQVLSIIEKKDRRNAGVSVPAHGLKLFNVCYPNDIFINQNE
jgi:tRNA pseudouridine38-40 synthase